MTAWYFDNQFIPKITSYKSISKMIKESSMKRSRSTEITTEQLRLNLTVPLAGVPTVKGKSNS
ncbi:hypothetical protein LguiA_002458 [Lonicera macranthoides]